MPVVLRLAWPHLSSKPRQTALTVAGVALGVAVFVFIVSMMDGLVVFFTQRLIRTAPLLAVLTERIDAVTPREALAGCSSGEESEIRLRSRAITGLAPQVRQLEALTGCEVETREETSESSLQLFRMIGMTTCLRTGFVPLVAGLGVANTLTTIILETERDIAILRGER